MSGSFSIIRAAEPQTASVASSIASKVVRRPEEQKLIAKTMN